MSVATEVLALDDEKFVRAAEAAAESLRVHGHALVEVAPGDMTLYRLSIIDADRGAFHDWQEGRWVAGHDMGGGRYLVASNHGPLYAWSGRPMHWDYAAEHYVTDHREWTARVIARFLTTLSNLMNGEPG